MSYVPIEELLSKTGSIYKLVILASHRAAELNNGAPKLVDHNNLKVTSLALEEIATGKVKLEVENKKD